MFPIESSKSLRYNFAHLALPILVLMNPNKFYHDISGTGGKKYLNTMWQGLAGRMGIRQSPPGPELSKIILREDVEAFIITLPKPFVVPDAFFVSAVFQFKNLHINKEIEVVRYFTLELGKNLIDQSDEYHFCEWEGNVLTKRQHKNYGRLANGNINSFISAITEVLNTNKSIEQNKHSKELNIKVNEEDNSLIHQNIIEQSLGPKPINEMSKLEQWELARKLLSGMEEEAIKRAEKEEAIRKETMVYVDKAIKERNRSIVIRNTLFVVIALIIVGVIIILFFSFALIFLFSR